MIVCPVCEHAQAAGSECEVCGRRLQAGRSTDEPVAPLEGLEATLQAKAPEAGIEPLADLEPTRVGPVGAGTQEPSGEPDLEPTAASPVEVVVEVVPGLERIEAAIPGDLPTPEPSVVVCRYCRTAAAPGERTCGRCGMRLPWRGPVALAEAPPRLCSCGMPITGSRCPACGSRNEVA
jgi:hypothetical protein